MDRSELKKIAKDVRADLLRMTNNTGQAGAHIGGSLSLVEIMVSLYYEVMELSPDDLTADDRSRLILSKGHGVMTQYVVLSHKGIIPHDELMTFKHNDTRLYAHPSMNPDIAIEFSSGSLGQGLSLGVGAALAMRRRDNKAKVIVILGDGECDEGQVWESAASAAHYGLDNIIVVVDENKLQYDGDTKDVMKKDLAARWSSFGFETVTADGHDFESLEKAFNTGHEGKPLALIAETVKGKGVSFMENNPEWHNKVLPEKDLEAALEGLEDN